MRSEKGKEGKGWKGTILKFIKDKEVVTIMSLQDLFWGRGIQGATNSQIASFMSKQGWRVRNGVWVNIISSRMDE